MNLAIALGAAVVVCVVVYVAARTVVRRQWERFLSGEDSWWDWDDDEDV
jgi:hypothetical protein